MAKKYYIIPTTEISHIINKAESAEDAMEKFALEMDFDMNTYFRAVTEDEYKKIIKRKQEDTVKNSFTEWAEEVVLEDFDEYDFTEQKAREIAERAWEVNCEGRGLTEYECIEEAIDEYKKGDEE